MYVEQINGAASRWIGNIARLHKPNISDVKQKNNTENLESQFKPSIYISLVIDNKLINIVYNSIVYSVASQKKLCGNKLQKIYFSSEETPWYEVILVSGQLLTGQLLTGHLLTDSYSPDSCSPG